ncbi:MAG TPA: acyl-CoA dehydrogenase family protein [Dehalococcoidia bacterium]|nr:acyl-CoA dehydrogenase family protein [Dehalococcoidia bacterium]
MDFRFEQEEEAFRQEVRAFVRAELPEWWGREAYNDREDAPREHAEIARAFQRKLAERGWLTLAWPKEYGGLGAGAMRQLVYNEEMSYLRAPGFGGMGVAMVGPTLMLHGTEAQKARFLGPIARGEMSWCQGFSEPGAGSDLASLQTRAVIDGDDFVVTGQKIWTSGAHRADYCILLARTDPEAPKHKGISYLLMDMKSPGITITPLTNMLNSAAFNQLFLDEVRIPRENLVGELNRGWYVATTTLDFERSGIQRIVFALRLLEDLVEHAKTATRGGRRLIDDPVVRHRLADLHIEFAVGRTLAYRVAWMQGQGLVPNAEASVAKLYSTELQSRFAAAAMGLLGPAAALMRASAYAPMFGSIPSYYLAAASYTIAAGTSEVQRNIIAQRGLGMPRG